MSTPALLLLAVAAAGYLLGSVSFGLLAARLWGLGDLRQIGSGNIGATNVLRTGNRAAAAFTLIGDAGKAAAAVLIAVTLVGRDAAQVAGLAACLGHCFPIGLGLRGGKGVATVLGMLIALAPAVGLAAAAVWIGTAAILRISSLAALVAAALAPVLAWAFGRPELSAMAVALAALVFVRHAGNIRRLVAGTEPRIGKSKEADR